MKIRKINSNNNNKKYKIGNTLIKIQNKMKKKKI